MSNSRRREHNHGRGSPMEGFLFAPTRNIKRRSKQLLNRYQTSLTSLAPNGFRELPGKLCSHTVRHSLACIGTTQSHLYICGQERAENLANNSGVIKALSTKHSRWSAAHRGVVEGLLSKEHCRRACQRQASLLVCDLMHNL